jgi:flagellar protein FlaJ
MVMLRRYLVERRPWFGWLRESLTGAAITTTYDRYLARGARYAAVPTVLGFVAAVGLGYAGFVPIGVAAGVGGVFLGVLVLAGFLLYPPLLAERRAREIDAALPYALMVTRVLSKTGMSFIDITGVLAESEDVYGELSVEIKRMRREVTYYGNDLLTAIEWGQENTPSDELSEFLEDLATVLRSRTDFLTFAERQYSKQYRRVKRHQEDFLRNLASFAQVYITLVFVGPLLALILLVLLSLSGADTLSAVYVTTYLYPVLGVGLALVFLNAMESGIGLPKGFEEEGSDPETPPDSPTYMRYRMTKARRKVLGWRPTVVRRKPLLSVVVTVPVVAVSLLFFFDGVGTGPAGFYAEDPIDGTALFVAAGVFVAAPVAVLYELRRLEERRLLDAIPDAYQGLAEAVSVGMTPAHACRVVSEEVGGRMGDELRRIHDEASLLDDTAVAFSSAAERVGVSEFRLTAKTTADALRTTNELEGVLRSLAEEAEARVELREERRSSMAIYAAVVVLGLLTYVMAAVFLDLFFLPRLAEVTEATRTGFLSPPTTTTEEYKVLLFHASLIQGGLNGLFMGKLRDGKASAGLRYSVVFVTAVTAVFLAI